MLFRSCLSEAVLAPIGTAISDICVGDGALSVARGGGSTSVLRSQPASNPGKSSAASVEIRMNDPCSMSLDNIERVKPFPYYALARDHPEQIMLVGILDFDIDDVAGFQRLRELAQIDIADRKHEV